MTRSEVVELITEELAKHTDPSMSGSEHRCHCGETLWKQGNAMTMKRHRAECVAAVLDRNELLNIERLSIA